MNVATNRQLTPAQLMLLTLMQRIAYGRIEDLPVQEGQPVMQPLPYVVREVKFGLAASHNEHDRDRFQLRTQVVQCFEQLEKLGSGTVRSLEIQDGIPFRMTLEEVAR